MEDKKALKDKDLEKVNGGIRYDWQTEELKIAFSEASEYFAYKANHSELCLSGRVSEQYSKMAELCGNVNVDSDENILETLAALRSIVNGEMCYNHAKREFTDLEDKINRILQ